jgi:hypothetical protein
VPKAYRPVAPGQSNPARNGKAHPRLTVTTGPGCDGMPAPAPQPSDPTVPAEAAATEPFAALPHRIVADPDLSDADVRVLLGLLYFARDKSSCWPSLRQLGEHVHKSIRSVREAIERLERHGYVKREEDISKRTWQRFVLTWRPDEGPAPMPLVGTAAPPAKNRRPPRRDSAAPPGEISPGARRDFAGPPRRKIAAKREASLVVGEGEEKHSGEAAAAAPQVAPAPAPPPIGTERGDGSLISNENENEDPQVQPLSPAMRQTLERLIGAGGNAAAQARKHLARDDALRAKAGLSTKTVAGVGPAELKARTATLMERSKPRPETLARLQGISPGCDPHHVDLVVGLLCRELDGDGHSQPHWINVLNSVRRGELPGEAVVLAYVRACGPKVRHPGKVFNAAIKEAQRGVPRP